MMKNGRWNEGFWLLALVLVISIERSRQVPNAPDDDSDHSRTYNLSEISENEEIAKSPSNDDASLIPVPGKRFVGSIAKGGGFPSAYNGKRLPPANNNGPSSEEESNNDNVEAVKRYLGSVLRQGFAPGKRQEEEGPAVLVEEAEPVLVEEEKRHIGALMRMGPIGRSESFSNPDKRFLGSLARNGQLGDGSRFTGYADKRYLGSLARSGQLGSGSKFAETDKRFLGSFRAGQLSDGSRFIGETDKRFLGSLARAGQLGDGSRFTPDADKRFLGSLARAGQLGDGSRFTPDADKRFLGSLARAGQLSDGSRFTGDSDKRFLGSLARASQLGPGSRFTGEADKRFLGSLARAGQITDGSQYAGKSEKRFLGSLARSGQIGDKSRFTGNDDKRYIGSLAYKQLSQVQSDDGKKEQIGAFAPNSEEHVQYPYRSKRSIDPVYIDYEDGLMEGGNDYEEGSDDFLVPMKRNIAALARNGWLPHIRSQRRQKPPVSVPVEAEEETWKRNFYPRYRPTSSVSSRSRLLTELQREEERLEKEAEEQEYNNIHDKRTIAALARSGELPIRYRTSRSADLLPSPPFMRMASYRGSGGASSFIKAPHAFNSLHVDGWGRPRRSPPDDVDDNHNHNHSQEHGEEKVMAEGGHLARDGDCSTPPSEGEGEGGCASNKDDSSHKAEELQEMI